MQLILLPVDESTDALARKVASNLRRIVPWKVTVSRRLEGTPAPNEGNSTDAIELLTSFAEALPIDTIAVAITPHDITISGKDHVFGYALPEENMAIVSTFQLAATQKLRHRGRLLLQRTCKELLHEAGHVRGLEHCDTPTCVMRYSQTLHDTDLKQCRFCPICALQLSKLPHVIEDGEER